MIFSLMIGCAVDRWPLRLPTETKIACGQWASISGVTSASCSTMSASRSKAAPRSVIKSAAPGPAPINQTLPGWESRGRESGSCMENLSENSVHNDIVGAGLSLPGNPVLRAMLASSGTDGAQRWILTFVRMTVQGTARLNSSSWRA